VLKIAKSISRIVEEKISNIPLLEDYLARGLINQSALARELLPTAEKALDQKVKPQAVIMAVKRYAASTERKEFTQAIKNVLADCTINLKSGVTDIAINLSENLFPLLNELSKKVKPEKGEVLSFVQGFAEAAIIIDDKFADFILSKISKKSILVVEKSSVILYLLAPPEFWDVPGIIYYVTQHISKQGINIVDIVTTQTELSIIVRKEEAGKAFEALSSMIEESKSQKH